MNTVVFDDEGEEFRHAGSHYLGGVDLLHDHGGDVLVEGLYKDLHGVPQRLFLLLHVHVLVRLHAENLMRKRTCWIRVWMKIRICECMVSGMALK